MIFTSIRNFFIKNFFKIKFLRNFYIFLKNLPIIGKYVYEKVNTIFPKDTHILIKIPSGLGKGLFFYVNPRYEPGYLNGDHEPWLQEFLKKELKKGFCFYDIGAHKGFFTIIASVIVGENGKVVAFEPDPRNHIFLKRNVEINKIKNVFLVKKALFSYEGKINFSLSNFFSNWTESKILNSVEIPFKKANNLIEVECTTLDKFISENKNFYPNLIKIDVEGAEIEILKGASETLKNIKPIWFIEVHTHQKIDFIISLFKKFNYKIEILTPSHPSYPDYRQTYVCAKI